MRARPALHYLTTALMLSSLLGCGRATASRVSITQDGPARLVDYVSVGDQVSVALHSGKEVEGRVSKVSNDSLAVEEAQWALDEIERIQLLDRRGLDRREGTFLAVMAGVFVVSALIVGKILEGGFAPGGSN